MRLDVSKARAFEGVACVLTGADLPDRTASTDIPGQVSQKRLDTGQQILVTERVRYFGEPLALVAAETRDIADHAVELVEAELEPLPGVYDPLEALKPGAPIVQGTTNVVAERRIRKGDVDAGFAAYEQQMDEAAKAIGLDRMELRRRNFLNSGEPISTGFVPPSAIWPEECAARAWAALGDPTPARGPRRVGRGIACYQQSYGRLTFLHDTSEAWAGVEMDGTVVVRSGVTDIGAGQVSALGQIAVEVLGVTLENVVIYNSDTAVTPLAGTTTVTRALYMTGNAVKQAAEAVRARLAERAARELGVAADDIDMAFNEVFVANHPERSIPLVDLVPIWGAEGIHRSELAMFRAPFSDFLDPGSGQGQAHPDYAYGAHAVEISVDVDTGEVEVLKSVAAHDVGQCINPAAVEGQIQGGARNGQGFALSEEMLYEEGRLVTPSFSEYLMPTAMDMPKVECILLESRSGVGPFGAKGIGEPAMTPVAPAIANAVADAIGMRVFEMPLTLERVVMAMKQHAAAG